MAFKGDLKDINLADIFQTLAMNQQEGTLTITSSERHTEIYFSKEGVRLLATGNQEHIRLGELLLKRRKLTPVELDMALARQKMTGELLGQALVDMNVVSDQDILDCVRSQIEEDIYEVFSWKKARFEFAPGEPSGEFYDPAKTGKPIAFNVNAVIMEAARRIDEWSLIHKNVPSTSTIYMLQDPQAAIPDVSHLGFAGEDILQIVKTIDGRSTVEQIVSNSALSKFEVCKIIAALVETGYITKLDLKETIRIADGLHREGNKEGAIKIYIEALSDQPRDAQLRLKLAELFETEGMKNEAATEYAKAGQTYLDSGASDDGLALYRKAIELAPKNFAVRQKLFSYYVSAQKFDLAAREGLFVAKTYWRMNRLEDAQATLDQVLQMSPNNVESLQMLTSIHIDMEEPDKALERYETLAKVFELKNEESKLLECYRKMLVLAPKRGDLRNKLNSLLSKQKKAKKGTGNRKLAYVLVILVVVIGAAAAYFVIREIDARSQWSELKKKIDAALAEVPPDTIDEAAEERLQELADRAEAFRSKNSLSFLVMADNAIDAAIQNLHKRREEIEGKRTQQYQTKVEGNDRLYHNARLKEQEGYIEDALNLYQKVDRKLLPKPIATDIETKIRYWKQYLSESKRLYKEIQDLIKEKKWEQAYLKTRELIENYGKSKEAAGLKLPLVIESTPGGAEVKIGGLVVGKTPYVHMREPGHMFDVSVSKKPGYTDPDGQKAHDTDWKVSFTLAKEPVWEYQAVGMVENAPVADSERVYFTTRDGVAYSLDMKDGKRVWQFVLPAGTIGKNFQVSPLLAEGKVYVGASSGVVYALDAKKGKKLWEIMTGAGIRGISSNLSNSGVFYVGGAKKMVYGVDVTRQAVLDDTFQTGDEIWSNPAYKNENIYVGSNDAKLYAIGAGTMQETWSYQTLGAVMTEPVFYKDESKNLVIFGSSDKTVYALHAAPMLPQGVDRLVWHFKTKGEVTVSQVVEGGHVYAASSDGNLYCLDAKDGTQKWVVSTGASAVSSPLVVDGVVYFGTSDKFFYAVSAENGKELWRYATSGEIRGGACTSAGLVEIEKTLHNVVIVGSADGTIYCFTTD